MKFRMSCEKICACKGSRSCLICESAETENARLGSGSGRSQTQNGDSSDHASKEVKNTYTYCMECRQAWEGSDVTSHPNHSGVAWNFPGIDIVLDFITETEELSLVEKIYETKFTDSQSGRRKQDYGPKVNFKKQKINCKPFSGLPSYFKEFYDRMLKLKILKDFIPVELCNLEYVPERGSAIDPHFDDFWLWGERLVTVNLLSDSVLTFTSDEFDTEVCVPLIRRSLIVVYGPARNEWKHAIKRQDISHKRLAVTCRELSPLFMSGGEKAESGQFLTELALNFNGSAVGSLET